MKFRNRGQLEMLSGFQPEDFLTTSFYLDTDKSRKNRKEITLSFKNILSSAKEEMARMKLSKEKEDSLTKDLEKISLFCSQNLSSFHFPGLAIFSCHGQNFWQPFELPQAPRNRAIFDRNPYVRPLSAILEENRSICAIVLNRREGKWHEIFMGEIVPLESITSDVPSRVREGGWEGYESKRIERHINAHLHEHFKAIAQKTFDIFKKNEFDWLFLGCPEEYSSDFESLLHPYLLKRLKARMKVRPGDSADSILKESLKIEKTLKKEEQETLLHELTSALERGGRATSGLKNTLHSLNQGEVQTLVVTRSYSREGRMCPSCHWLFVDEFRCPSCQKKTEPVPDVIDEAVEAAMRNNSQVRHVSAPSALDRFGKIGAFLRYRA